MATPDKVAGPASCFPSIEKAYGKPIEHWMQVLSSAGLHKHMELVSPLKSDHQLGRGHANARVAWPLAKKWSNVGTRYLAPTTRIIAPDRASKMPMSITTPGRRGS